MKVGRLQRDLRSLTASDCLFGIWSGPYYFGFTVEAFFFRVLHPRMEIQAALRHFGNFDNRP